MKKASRFWWLHGAILLSAVIGCKNCGGGGCGPSGTAGTPPGGMGTGGPVGGAGASLYSQGAMPNYSGGSPMSGGASPFTSPSGMGYPSPNMSSAMPTGMGSTRQ